MVDDTYEFNVDDQNQHIYIPIMIMKVNLLTLMEHL